MRVNYNRCVMKLQEVLEKLVMAIESMGKERHNKFTN